MNDNPASNWFRQLLDSYNQSFVSNAFADSVAVLGVQPTQFGFPTGFYQPAPQYRPPAAGQSPMSRALALSRKKSKIKSRLKRGPYHVHNGEVFL
jgi:hypothetical protein